jgi:hypothetical protein
LCDLITREKAAQVGELCGGMQRRCSDGAAAADALASGAKERLGEVLQAWKQR